MGKRPLNTSTNATSLKKPKQGDVDSRVVTSDGAGVKSYVKHDVTTSAGAMPTTEKKQPPIKSNASSSMPTKIPMNSASIPVKKTSAVNSAPAAMDQKPDATYCTTNDHQTSMKQEQAEVVTTNNTNSEPNASTATTNGSSSAPPLPETVKVGVQGGLIISFVIMCCLMLSSYISKGQHQEILQRASALVDAKKAGLQSELIKSTQEDHAFELDNLRMEFDNYREIMSGRMNRHKLMSQDFKAAKESESKAIADAISLKTEFKRNFDLLNKERKRAAELEQLVKELRAENAELESYLEEEEDDDDEEDGDEKE